MSRPPLPYHKGDIFRKEVFPKGTYKLYEVKKYNSKTKEIHLWSVEHGIEIGKYQEELLFRLGYEHIKEEDLP